MHAAASGNAAAVQVVLVLGNLQLEARDKDGDTAFLAACSTGDPECIAELIKAGCNTTAKNNKGQTGLMEAAQSESAEAVRAVLLLDRTELEARDEDRCIGGGGQFGASTPFVRGYPKYGRPIRAGKFWCSGEANSHPEAPQELS